MLKHIKAMYDQMRVFVALVFLAGLALGGCAPSEVATDAELDRGHRFKPPYQVEHTVHRHLIPVSATRSNVDEQQFHELYNFLVGVGAKTGDTVVLASRRSRLDRRHEVELFLNRVGLRPQTKLIKENGVSGEDDGYDEVVMVEFDRYTPRQPECGKWGEDKKFRTNFYNTSPRNFGCSTVWIEQQQAAYPGNLISGQLLDFPEGDYAAEAVSRYRGRKVEQIKAEGVGGGG